ncbi:unnamed protein product [Leptidea sinapis]|uniref:Uncharacterized protein n=1 Tax=Leptidea sinapis TaxID=189913 RepID=A0A5E4PNR7_9NEOP|nr:unnamed protein product [Leptidea sinapis]
MQFKVAIVVLVALVSTCCCHIGDSILPPYYKEQDNPLGWPLVTPHKAHGLSRGKRQFVVSECCDKPCSINELLSYC